jgi:sugar phosphate isomerase/epimerase
MFRSLSPGAIGIRASLTEGLELAKAANFQGLDVNIGAVAELVAEKSADYVKKLFDDAGLKMGAWGLPVNWRGDEAELEQGLERLRRLAKVGQSVGCTRLSTWIPPTSNDKPFKENFDFHVQRFRPIGQVLSEYECQLGLEFIGPKTSRTGRKYEFIYTMEGMLELCDEIGTGNIGLLLDAWHWYTSHGTLDDLKKLTADQVVHVHINDAPAGIPVDEQIDNIRRLPGETGVIDLVGFLKCLDKIGYEGPVTPEPFSDKVKGLPPLEAAKITAEGLLRVWKEAGLS